jgi:NADH:ubiquinone oxidoreductase subunit F (NADH-binding)
MLNIVFKLLTETSQKTLHRHCRRITKRTDCVTHDFVLLFGVQDKIMGNTICALGDAAAMPVESFLRCFREEFEYYIEHGESMVKGD